MSQSLSQIYLHVIFSTKERKPFLQNPDCSEAMHRCLAKISNELGCPCLEAGGVEDTCTRSASTPARSITLSVSEFVKRLKRATTSDLGEGGLSGNG